MDKNSKQRGGSGNFANDPKRASEAGKKGGEHSHQQSQSGSHGGQHGSPANDTGAPKGVNRSNAGEETS